MKTERVLEAVSNLVDAHDEYLRACREFHEATTSYVLYNSYMHLSAYPSPDIRKLADLLVCEIREMPFPAKEGYRKYEFDYRGKTFMWLEEINENK